MTRVDRVLTAIALLAIGANALADSPAGPAEGSIGFQVARVTDTNGKSFGVGVWYPAGAQSSSSAQSGPNVMGAVQNASVAGMGLPLVVISHGNGGGMTSHIDLAMALAGAGYVVAAPMHPGDNFQDSSSSGLASLYSDRNRQLRLTIDYMLTKWPRQDAIDAKMVGAFGLSAGGFTVLTVAGAQPDMRLIPKHCSQSPEFICEVLRHYRSPLLDADAPAAEPMQASPVVKAIVVAAPGLGFTLTPAAMAGVKVPVQLWSGEKDDKVPYVTNAKFVVEALGTKVEFHSVPNAGHLSFLAPCGPAKIPEVCTDPEGFDRAAFHASMNAEVVRFFNTNLKH